MKTNYIDRVLVLTTTGVIAIVMMVFGSYMYSADQSPIAQVDTEGHPMMGSKNAKVQLVIFEEIRCIGCQYFNQKILPRVKAQYIDTGKVSYVVVPISFFEGTKEAANAAISVYKFHPDRFFAYVEKLHKLVSNPRDTVDQESLVRCAAEVGGIDLAHLKRSIQGNFFYKELEKNLETARDVMNGQVMTPALYINGVFCSTRSAQEVLDRIDSALSISES